MFKKPKKYSTTLKIKDDDKGEYEQVKNLRYDNSVLSSEVISLTKELTKFKQEIAILSNSLIKSEKERAELKTKLAAKTEGFNKAKKENDDLKAFLNSSKAKDVL